jgi:hypothetical protein
MFQIKYDNGIINRQFLTPLQTKQQPTVFYNFVPNELYTLIMYDPDTPHGDYVHWLIINIKDNIKNGEILIPYKGPSPPINTGIHRYIFLLFRQQALIKKSDLNDVERNIQFNNLLDKLSLINKPIEQIYFTSEYQSGGKKMKKMKSKKYRSKKNKTKKIKNKSI